MSLSQARITPQIAVADMARARDFYEGKLGLTGGQGKGTNEKGIHDSGYGKIAWVLDPDGNTFEICQTD
jgi:catechol 2,3-dioxygenase-like lactoylglutathione lyase family enzyme